jgi:hypothetical protein
VLRGSGFGCGYVCSSLFCSIVGIFYCGDDMPCSSKSISFCENHSAIKNLQAMLATP